MGYLDNVMQFSSESLKFNDPLRDFYNPIDLSKSNVFYANS